MNELFCITTTSYHSCGRIMKVWLLLTVAILWIHLATGRCSYASSSSSLSPQEQRQEQIEQAFELLTISGITDLCHPSSDELAPFFPKCQNLDYHPRLLLPVAENEIAEDWFYTKNCLGVVICVVMAALAAGLTIGLLSLDPLVLLIKIRAGSTELEKTQAASLLPIVKQHHLLLVTLLLLNSMANEALPIFLDAMVPSLVAVIISVTLVLFFGEIIPSAVFTGPNQLKIASQLAPVVKLVMFVLCPLAWPIARALDVILHDEDEAAGSSYNRSELAALVRILYEERLANKQRRKKERILMGNNFDSSHPSTLLDGSIRLPIMDSQLAATIRSLKREISDGEAQNHQQQQQIQQQQSSSVQPPPGRFVIERMPSIHIDEVSMVEGALQMKTKLALDVFTPIRKIFCIPFDMILTEMNVVQIYSHGYSRIPVYMPNPDKEKDKQAICGVLLTKQLIVVNMSDNRPVSTLPLQIPQCVSPKANMVDLLNMFQTGGSARKGGHLALVCTRPEVGNQALQWGLPVPEEAGLLGVITLEDVLEELLQEEILDESDKPERVRASRVQRAFKKWRLYVKKKKLQREEEELSLSAAKAEQPKLLKIVLQATSVRDQVIGDMSSSKPSDTTPLLKTENSEKAGWKFGSFFEDLSSSKPSDTTPLIGTENPEKAGWNFGSFFGV